MWDCAITTCWPYRPVFGQRRSYLIQTILIYRNMRLIWGVLFSVYIRNMMSFQHEYVQKERKQDKFEISTNHSTVSLTKNQRRTFFWSYHFFFLWQVLKTALRARFIGLHPHALLTVNEIFPVLLRKLSNQIRLVIDVILDCFLLIEEIKHKTCEM